ncbi:histidine--tRNA ligase [Xylophilus sp. Kf1]|nr:histidine--tRNA ligase [Xylophilus sp. Kf1]
MSEKSIAAAAAGASVGKVSRLSGVKGMNDILPPESARWEWFEARVRDLMARYAFRNIRTPIVEPTALFVRGTGQTTDIVEKEMYSFQDRLNGEELTLRPENTPGVVRAAIEQNLTYDGGKRLYYIGQMFRHERPQRGRYRQFHQLGVEALGFAGPEMDAEVMLLVQTLLQELGVRNVRVELNSLGVPAERQAHRAALIAHFEAHADLLDEDARRRLHANPLRILDTKNPAMQDMVGRAPQLLDYLGEASRTHFETVQALLTACEVPWTVNPRLVRGLDYYSHTVFEFITDELGAQGTLCGGGRYDGLFEVLGGKPTPAVGWGMGIERVLELIASQQSALAPPSLDAYAIVPDAASLTQVVPVLQAMRRAGISVQMHAGTGEGMGSFKSQFKKADASGALFALVFGTDELARGEVTVKSLRDGSGAQRLERLDAIGTWGASLQSRA